MAKSFNKVNTTNLLRCLAAVILLLALSFTQQNFLGKSNLAILLRDPSALLIMSSGTTMVLIFGSIDLSVGAVCSVSNVLYLRIMLILAEQYTDVGMISLIAWVCALGFGLLSGLMLGLIHVKLKVPSFIASLGFMSLWQSVALLITERPESVRKILWPAVNWYKMEVGVLGLPMVIALAITLVIFVITKFTPFGKAIYAIGGNERTARIAGIDVDKTKIIVFTVNGLLASVAGVFLVANLKSSAPTIGESYTLKTIAACALGGTSLSGGSGNVLGTVLGVYMVTFINAGMTFMGINPYWQNIVFGVFVLISIAVSTDRHIIGQIVK